MLSRLFLRRSRRRAVISARAADSQTAVVTLQARSRPPFLPWGIIPAEGFTITATGSARMTTTQ